MTSKHTPGPWQLGTLTTKSGRDKRGLSGGDGHRICDISVYDERDMADARLIAAAPDLLMAVNRLLRSFHPITNHDVEDYKFARAAIAKAEGK